MIPDEDLDLLVGTLRSLPRAQDARVRAALKRVLTYSPMLQFVLIDKVNRLFQTERYCFLGSIDDWITIGSKDELPRLVKTYVPHLGEESFYELY